MRKVHMETWYHACGYPILVGWQGPSGREVRVFYDGDPHHPNRCITACPTAPAPSTTPTCCPPSAPPIPRTPARTLLDA